MSYIISFVLGFVLGLVNKATIKGLIYGTTILPKGRFTNYIKSGWEQLTGFRARFIGLAMLLITSFLAYIFWYELALIKPFQANLSTLGFYLKVSVLIIGIYLSTKVMNKSVKDVLKF